MVERSAELQACPSLPSYFLLGDCDHVLQQVALLVPSLGLNLVLERFVLGCCLLELDRRQVGQTRTGLDSVAV